MEGDLIFGTYSFIEMFLSSLLDKSIRLCLRVVQYHNSYIDPAKLQILYPNLMLETLLHNIT